MSNIIVEIKDMQYEIEKQIKENFDEILFNNKNKIFFDLVLIKYCNDTKKTLKTSITKWNSSKKLRDMMRMFFKNNVYWKNLVKKENIYFSITELTRKSNFIWLDDIKLENVTEQQKKYLTLIETSENNYQAWIKLDKAYKKEEIQTIKKYLIRILGADPAASAWIQPMRLPGFYSHKRIEPFFVKVVRRAEKILDGEKLLKKIGYQKPQKNNNNNIYNNYNSGGGINLKNSFFKKENKKNDITFSPETEWQEILEYRADKFEDGDVNRVDRNAVDIQYIYQLIIRNYDYNDITKYMLKSRDDILDKHVLEDYIERTYLKALLFHKVFGTRPFFDNHDFNEYLEEQKKQGNWSGEKKVTDNLKILLNNLDKINTKTA